MKINEILEKTNNKLYPSRAIWGLKVAFTEMLKEFEKEDNSFQIVGCSPSLAVKRIYNEFNQEEVDETSATAVVGNWASFIYKNNYYYIQFDNYNPLFECYFQKTPIINNKTPDGYLREFDFYGGCELYTNTPNIEEIKSYMLKSFRNEDVKVYTSNHSTNPKFKTIEQRIYFK